MFKDNIPNICLTIFGLGVCAVFISFVGSCTEAVKNGDMIELKKREACLEKGGSVIVGPNNVMNCLVFNK